MKVGNKTPFIDNHGYRMVDAPSGHPYARCKGIGSGKMGGSTGYIKEHRAIMEQHLGRILHPHEHIHHKNHDKLDNRLENLELLSVSEHMRLHWINPRKRPGAPVAGEPCANCGNVLRPVKADGRRGLCNACYLRARRSRFKSGAWPVFATQFGE